MKLFRTLLFLLALTLLTGCAFSLAADVTPPPGMPQSNAAQPQPQAISGPLYPLVPPNPESGKPIYVEKCAPCHGDTGQGDGPNASRLPNPVAALGNPDLPAAAPRPNGTPRSPRVTWTALCRPLPTFRTVSAGM